MNAREIKEQLLLRRGPADENDPEVAAAARAAQSDGELAAWRDGEEVFHRRIRDEFRKLPVPSDLSRRLRHAQRRREGLRRRPWLWAAAAMLLLAGLVATQWFWSQRGLQSDHSFATYRSRMVRSVLREYQMDLKTNDLAAIRRFHQDHAAPADYQLPPGLARLPAVGAGLKSWLGQRVSMVCLNSGTQGTAILFVVEAEGVTLGPASTEPEFAQVSRVMTASWTERGKAYLLFVDGEKVDRAALQRLL